MSEEKPETSASSSSEAQAAFPGAQPSASPTAAQSAKAASAKTSAKAATTETPKLEEHEELVAADSAFKIERRNPAHRKTDAAKKLGPRQIEITHGSVVCGAAVRDKLTRGRISEGRALVGDRITISGEEAAVLVANQVAKYVDPQSATETP